MGRSSAFALLDRFRSPNGAMPTTQRRAFDGSQRFPTETPLAVQLRQSPRPVAEQRQEDIMSAPTIQRRAANADMPEETHRQPKQIGPFPFLYPRGPDVFRHGCL